MENKIRTYKGYKVETCKGTAFGLELPIKVKDTSKPGYFPEMKCSFSIKQDKIKDYLRDNPDKKGRVKIEFYIDRSFFE